MLNDHAPDYTAAVCAMTREDGSPAFARSKTPEQIEDPVTLYRRTLAAQPDRSVTVLSLGFATELAKLLWTEAGKPAPAAVMAEDATDEQKALTWAVESQLISADKPADASVGRWEVIRGWNRVKEMK